MNAHLQMANCSESNQEPTKSLYNCLCEAHNQLMGCYSICPDDPNLQLQRLNTEQHLAASCKAALEFPVEAVSSVTPIELAVSIPISTISVGIDDASATASSILGAATSQLVGGSVESSENSRRPISDRPVFASDATMMAFSVVCLFISTFA
jgi:hypothetical protein